MTSFFVFLNLQMKQFQKMYISAITFYTMEFIFINYAVFVL